MLISILLKLIDELEKKEIKTKEDTALLAHLKKYKEDQNAVEVLEVMVNRMR